ARISVHNRQERFRRGNRGFAASYGPAASANAIIGRYSRLPGSCMATRAFTPRRELPPTNQTSACASRAYSLPIGVVPLRLSVPFGLLEIFKRGRIARKHAK